jgi:F0F1-type ATP synthase membrane subunit b/b'
MLRPDPTTSDRNGVEGASTNGNSLGNAARGSVDIQRELNNLEEMILDSPRIPFSRRTLIDEEQILDQLDVVRLHLPTSFQEATEIVRHKEEIYLEAEQYAQELVESAERRAAQLLDEMGLIRQAEQEVKQIRQRVQQECEAAQEQTIADIERMRRQAQQDLEEMRQMTIAECEDIQAGADAYADRILKDMEQQLGDMIRVIRNGRQQLHPEPLPAKDAPATRQGQPNRPTERPKK